MRKGPRYKHRRKFPVYSLTRIEESTAHNGPPPFPNRHSPPLRTDDGKLVTTIGHTRVNDSGHGLTMVKIGPHTFPRKLAPIVKRKKTNKYDKQSGADVEETLGALNKLSISMQGDSSRPEISKMRTEYEPFESIAKRNQLNFTSLLNSSLAYRRNLSRRPVNMSTVTIIDERPHVMDSKPLVPELATKKLVNPLRDRKPR